MSGWVLPTIYLFALVVSNAFEPIDYQHNKLMKPESVPRNQREFINLERGQDAIFFKGVFYEQ